MKFRNQSSESGQSLLVIVLLISVVFVLIATASYRLTTETQSSKAQEEGIRVLAAADSGIEKGVEALGSGGFGVGTSERTFQQLGLSLNGIDASRSKVVIEASSGTGFESPVIQANEQYLFYVSDYNVNTGVFSNEYTGRITVYFAGGGTGTCSDAGRTRPALDMLLIYGDGTRMERRLLEPCNVLGEVVAGEDIERTLVAIPGGQEVVPGGTRYFYTFNINNLGTATYPTPKVIVFRPLFTSTRIGVVPQTGQPLLPVQGTNIRAEAYAVSGVSKIVTLFQPSAQFPADFFVTTF